MDESFFSSCSKLLPIIHSFPWIKSFWARKITSRASESYNISVRGHPIRACGYWCVEDERRTSISISFRSHLCSILHRQNTLPPPIDKKGARTTLPSWSHQDLVHSHTRLFHFNRTLHASCPLGILVADRDALLATLVRRHWSNILRPVTSMDPPHIGMAILRRAGHSEKTRSRDHRPIRQNPTSDVLNFYNVLVLHGHDDFQPPCSPLRSPRHRAIPMDSQKGGRDASRNLRWGIPRIYEENRTILSANITKVARAIRIYYKARATWFGANWAEDTTHPREAG